MVSYILLFILLCLSFFFSGTETAVTASSNALLHEKEKQGNVRAKRLNELKKNPSSVISTLLFGNNIVNIAITAISTALCIQFFGDAQNLCDDEPERFCVICDTAFKLFCHYLATVCGSP